MQRLVVLHQRPMGESNWLLNIFSEQDGHQLVLAPRRAGRLALWQLYQGEWRSDKDWPRMTVSDRLSELKYQRQQLFCCTYLSELLIQLLPMADAQPQLFQRFLTLLWRESGGPLVAPPTREGFGARLIRQTFEAEQGGRARIQFPPEGAHCSLLLALMDEEAVGDGQPADPSPVRA